MEIQSATQGQECGHCGSGIGVQARFCPECGTETNALSTGAPVNHIQVTEPEESVMRLRIAWGVWAAGIGLMWGLISLEWFGAAFCVYLGLGFVMTRIVMRRVIEFHPLHNTLANVVDAKVWMFLLWPVKMFMLLIHLSINKVL